MLTIAPTGAVLGATARSIDLARPLSERDMSVIDRWVGEVGGAPRSLRSPGLRLCIPKPGTAHARPPYRSTEDAARHQGGFQWQ